MKKTKYQAFADELALAIGGGKLGVNAKLPSVRELMQQHQLSLATVTKSLHLLEEKGLVEPRDKLGYFVKVPQKRNTPVRTGQTVDQTAEKNTLKDERKNTVPSGVTMDDVNDLAHEAANDGASGSMRNWRPAGDLFPEQRWQSLLGSVIRRYPFLPTRHAHDFGHPRLRQELARRSAENGCFLREDELIVTQGATEALSLALRATTEAGDRVLIQAPLGVLFKRLLETFTLTPAPILSRVDAPEFITELQSILEGDDPPKVLLLVANYHFPTGALMPLMTKRNLLRLAEKHELTIIEDDVYADLQYEGARPLTLKSFDLKGHVIYVNSCSKSLAPGLRIGWLASGRWRKRVEYLKSASASSVSDLSQLVLAEFLAQGSHVPHLRKIRKELKSRASEYLSILRLALGKEVSLNEVLGGYSFWLPFPQSVDTEEIKAQIQALWPLLDEPNSPQIVVVAQGLCVNTSVPLTDPLRLSLTAFCFYLRDFL